MVVSFLLGRPPERRCNQTYDIASKTGFVLVIELDLHIKNESCSFKIKQATVTFFIWRWGEMSKPQNFEILKYHSILNFSQHFCMWSNHTNQQVVYSKKRSNMAPLLVSRGGLWAPSHVSHSVWYTAGVRVKKKSLMF